MTPKKPEERIATLEERSDSQRQVLDELRSDVKAIPQQLQQFSDDLKATFRQETRRCRRIQARKCPAIRQKQGGDSRDGSEPSWTETIKQAAVGLSILGALLGSAYYGARDNPRAALPPQAAQGGTK